MIFECSFWLAAGRSHGNGIWERGNAICSFITLSPEGEIMGTIYNSKYLLKSVTQLITAFKEMIIIKHSHLQDREMILFHPLRPSDACMPRDLAQIIACRLFGAKPWHTLFYMDIISNLWLKFSLVYLIPVGVKCPLNRAYAGGNRSQYVYGFGPGQNGKLLKQNLKSLLYIVNHYLF